MNNTIFALNQNKISSLFLIYRLYSKDVNSGKSKKYEFGDDFGYNFKSSRLDMVKTFDICIIIKIV